MELIHLGDLSIGLWFYKLFWLRHVYHKNSELSVHISVCSFTSPFSPYVAKAGFQRHLHKHLTDFLSPFPPPPSNTNFFFYFFFSIVICLSRWNLALWQTVSSHIRSSDKALHPILLLVQGRSLYFRWAPTCVIQICYHSADLLHSVSEHTVQK